MTTQPTLAGENMSFRNTISTFLWITGIFVCFFGAGFMSAVDLAVGSFEEPLFKFPTGSIWDATFRLGRAVPIVLVFLGAYLTIRWRAVHRKV